MIKQKQYNNIMSQSQKIQRYIIKSTPFGQLPDVLKDLDKISQMNLSSPSITSAIEEYNQQHLAIISHPNGQLLVMGNCKVGENQYLDQNKEKIYTIDHIKQEVLSVQDTSVDLVPQVKQLVSYLSTSIQQYVDKYYKTPNGSQVFADISEEGLNIYVGITCKNINVGKFYTGEWISKWVINKDFIEGVVTIKAHFFEAGNVQFNQKRQLKEKFQFTPQMSESAKLITKAIEKFEASVQQSLNTLYDEMPNKFFKKLRKLAPYTKTKMAWNVNSVKMNKNLIGSK